MIISKEQLEQIHALELDALMKFDEVCRKYNIIYTLASGTLLGAVRHHGFIPWDDDMDVLLIRSEFEKLRNVPVEEWGTAYFYQSNKTDSNYKYNYDKLRINGTFFGEKALEGTGIKNNGIFIDIFPAEEVPNDYHQELQIIEFEVMRLLFMSKYININYRHGLEKNVAKIIRIMLKKIDLNKLYTINEQIIKKYDGIGSDRYRVFDSFNTRNELYTKEDLVNVEDMDFEGHKVMVSKNYDKILSNLYGDYMKLPPKNEQINKHEITKLEL